jgi:hypothetical protein
MMATFAVERRHRGFCPHLRSRIPLSSAYGFLGGAWPFGVGRDCLGRDCDAPIPITDPSREIHSELAAGVTHGNRVKPRCNAR